jgi:hypothetical protein
MGWAESPPNFCAFTETITDIVNTPHLPPTKPHPLLSRSQQHAPALTPAFTQDAIVLGHASQKPLAYTDMYIDDFMVIAQRPAHTPLLNKLLHSIDTVFHDPPNTLRRHVISLKKIDAGDAAFTTTKRFLGWDINTEAMTLALPSHCLEALTKLISSFLAQKRTSLSKWRRLLGTLRSTSPALYAASHYFSILQSALTTASAGRIRITPLTHAVLRDWLTLATTAAQHPVPLHTLVPHPPTVIAATDASKQGMGGFCVTQYRNSVWRAAYPPHIQTSLISTDNLTGTITNSDLGLAALVTGSVIAAQLASSTYPTVLIEADNTPAVAWTQKGSTTSTKANAYLLHNLARQRRANPFQLSVCFTPGATNTIADACSRLFHLSDVDFLNHINTTFPVQPCWTLVHPSSDMLSAVNSALLKKLQPLASPQAAAMPMTQHGNSGKPSALNCAKTPTLPTSKTPNHYYNYLQTDTVWESWLPVGLRLELELWKVPFEPWARRSPHWNSPIHACSPPGNLIYVSPAN